MKEYYFKKSHAKVEFGDEIDYTVEQDGVTKSIKGTFTPEAVQSLLDEGIIEVKEVEDEPKSPCDEIFETISGAITQTSNNVDKVNAKVNVVNTVQNKIITNVKELYERMNKLEKSMDKLESSIDVMEKEMNDMDKSMREMEEGFDKIADYLESLEEDVPKATVHIKVD